MEESAELENKNWDERDPLAPCIKARKLDLLGRILVGLLFAALLYYEVSLLGAALGFVYVFFFLPPLTSHDLTLKSGRVISSVRPFVSRSYLGRNAGRKILDVSYTTCTADSGALELQREFEELCRAVLQSCDHHELTAAEVTAELPKQASFLSLNFMATIVRSAEFEKAGSNWTMIELP